MKIMSLISASLLLLSNFAFATTWNQETTYYIYGSFSSYAYGKEVAGVYLHTGILKNPNTCGKQGQYYWESVQHIPMVKVGDHFFVKTKIQSGTGECSSKLEGPAVQYWVYFKDGTQLLTQTYAVPTKGTNASSLADYNAQILSNNEVFNTTVDAKATQAQEVSFSYAD